MRTLRAFVRLSRPHFLLGGALMFGFGAAASGVFNVVGYVVGQLMVTAAQITAHYVNEHYDMGPDRAVAHRTWFSGGSGVLVRGELAPSVAHRAALATTGMTLLAAAVLTTRSLLAAVLGVVALAVSWAYSAPPVRLLDTGIGEAATSVVVTGLVPVIGALAQEGSATPTLWWGSAVLLPVHMAMMLAFELPDIVSDAAAGKAVLAVRIGRRRTESLIWALLAAAVGISVAGIAAGGITYAALLVPAAVTALYLGDAVRTDRYGRITVTAVATLVLAGAGLTISALG